MDNTNVIIKPLVTEKSTHQQQTRNAYAFASASRNECHDARCAHNASARAAWPLAA